MRPPFLTGQISHAKQTQTRNFIGPSPSRVVPPECDEHRPRSSPFASHPPYLACPEYPEESHNSSVSCQSVDAPTLACRQGATISEHVPSLSSCLQLPSPADPPSLHRQTAEQRVSTIGPVVSATANGRGVYESLSPENVHFTAHPRAAGCCRRSARRRDFPERTPCTSGLLACTAADRNIAASPAPHCPSISM